MITRRQIILGIAGTGIVGVAVLHTAQQTDLTRALLHRLLGPFEIPEVEFQRFAETVLKARGYPSNWKIGIFTFAEQTGLINPMLALLPTPLIDGYAQWRRVVMTDFTMATNFFDRQRPAGKLSFTGPVEACSSPFAEFA